MAEKKASVNSETLLDNNSTKKIFKEKWKNTYQSAKSITSLKMRILSKCVYRAVKYVCNELIAYFYSKDKKK